MKMSTNSIRIRFIPINKCRINRIYLRHLDNVFIVLLAIRVLEYEARVSLFQILCLIMLV
jgi:hypothetical protein